MSIVRSLSKHNSGPAWVPTQVAVLDYWVGVSTLEIFKGFAFVCVCMCVYVLIHYDLRRQLSRYNVVLWMTKKMSDLKSGALQRYTTCSHYFNVGTCDAFPDRHPQQTLIPNIQTSHLSSQSIRKGLHPQEE